MKLEQLKKLAEATTPGPWEYTTAFGVRSEVSKNECGEAMPICSETNFNVGEYIAAANPDFILKMIAVIEAAEKVICEFCHLDDKEKDCTCMQSNFIDLYNEILKTKATNAPRFNFGSLPSNSSNGPLKYAGEK